MCKSVSVGGVGVCARDRKRLIKVERVNVCVCVFVSVSSFICLNLTSVIKGVNSLLTVLFSQTLSSVLDRGLSPAEGVWIKGKNT